MDHQGRTKAGEDEGSAGVSPTAVLPYCTTHYVWVRDLEAHRWLHRYDGRACVWGPENI